MQLNAPVCARPKTGHYALARRNAAQIVDLQGKLADLERRLAIIEAALNMDRSTPSLWSVTDDLLQGASCRCARFASTR